MSEQQCLQDVAGRLLMLMLTPRFPSLGLGLPLHRSAAYAVGNSPIFGVSFTQCPRGWVLGHPPSQCSTQVSGQ